MGRKIRIALAGNANVGKSVIFNYLTGLHQHIGNWPGKTVEKAEGSLRFKGYDIDVIDLPGIYSLSTYSIEERISREYIAVEKPDVVVNVVDASALERNLFFTIQLLELETPMVIALNQIDLADKKGIKIDYKKLEEILKVPVLPTVATKGVGLDKLLDVVVSAVEKKEYTAKKLKYGTEIETRIERIVSRLDKISDKHRKYPSRWLAIKLLENDIEIKKAISKIDSETVFIAEGLAKEIEYLHKESCSIVITAERYFIANKIANEVQQIVIPKKVSFSEKLDEFTTHKYLGYPILAAVVFSVLAIVFLVGNIISNSLIEFFMLFKPTFENIGGGFWNELIWTGIIESVIAGIAIVLPYIIPFYLILGLLEDTGYLPRVAFLVDNIMHKIGLHGKAFIPFILGYGCNVPACLGCRVMETDRERTLAIFVTTMVPCAARTVVILGLVGTYLGFKYAIALYALNLIVIFLLGRMAFKILPGEPMGLIMEMPPYRKPVAKVVLRQTWHRTKDFIIIAFPLIIAGGFVLNSLKILGLLSYVNSILSPVTVYWLGLPVAVGAVLIFGILRKELALVMLAAFLGTKNFATILTPIQMLTFTIVVMFYIPCVATIAALVKELKWKKALIITVFEIGFALLLGGLAYRILSVL